MIKYSTLIRQQFLIILTRGSARSQAAVTQASTVSCLARPHTSQHLTSHVLCFKQSETVVSVGFCHNSFPRALSSHNTECKHGPGSRILTLDTGPGHRRAGAAESESINSLRDSPPAPAPTPPLAGVITIMHGAIVWKLILQTKSTFIPKYSSSSGPGHVSLPNFVCIFFLQIFPPGTQWSRSQHSRPGFIKY